MDHFGSLFEKFKKFAVPHKEVRECVASKCGSIIKKEVPLSVVRVSGRVLYIDMHPTIKGEVLLHKKEILLEVNKTPIAMRQPFLDIR